MRLAPGDESELDWFFGEGQALFERSATGAMLDRAELYYVAARAGDVTARPTCETRPQGGYTPDAGRLGRYAVVSSRLKRMALVDAQAVRILSAYYGDVGARWGRTQHGRLFSLYSLTPAGEELLRRARKGRGERVHVSPAEELFSVVAVQRVQPMPARAMLVERARREAQEAYESACSLYAETARRGR